MVNVVAVLVVLLMLIPVYFAQRWRADPMCGVVGVRGRRP